MPEICESLRSRSIGRTLCCYINPSSAIQIARSSNLENWSYERVIFPGERLLFAAPEESEIEIHTLQPDSSMLMLFALIKCDRLRVEQGSRAYLETEYTNPVAKLYA